VEGPCEHGNEPSGSIICSEILKQLHNWWLLKGSAPWSWLVVGTRMINNVQRMTIVLIYHCHDLLDHTVCFVCNKCDDDSLICSQQTLYDQYGRV
jgi:hypothetical protein